MEFPSGSVNSSAMGFSVRITETETRNNLFPQCCLLAGFAKQETETGNTHGSGRPARPLEAKITKIPDVVAHRRACLLEFWIKFSGVSLTQKTSFQTQKCGKFDEFTFWESNILTNVCVMNVTNVCVVNVMMHVVCAGRTDR